MDIEDCFKAGYITKTHGLKGEVTVVLLEGIPARKAKSILVDIKGTLVPYFIQSISDRGDKAFVKLEDVDSPEQAKTLQGCSLYLPKKDRAPLARGQFYDDEVVGFTVEDVQRGELGAIHEVVQIGPNRLLVLIHKGKEVLIPVLGPFIQSINRSRKKIKVELPEGFLDI